MLTFKSLRVLMKRNIKFSALILMLISILKVQAQQMSKNIIEQEQESQINQWNASGNAAGLLLDNPSQNSSLEVGTSSTQGNFRQPYNGEKINTIFLNTKGNLYLKNYYLQGYFAYKRNNIKAAEYNASLIDPLRLMPYIVADTNTSDWVNQYYDLGFKLNTKPVAGKLMLGLNVNYKAQSGAKQRDIRANNQYYELQLDPALSLTISAKHHIGANFHYKNFKEQSSNSNVNTYVDQGYFFLLGLGNAIAYVGSGRTMNYEGDAMGFGVQYQYSGKSKIFTNLNYTVQAEDANIAFTNTRPGGTLLMKKWDMGLNFQQRGEEFTHLVQATMSTSNSSGIEYITEFVSGLESDGYYVLYKSVRSKYANTLVLGQYELQKNQGLAYNWKTTIYAALEKMANKYLIPESTMETDNLKYGIGIHKLFDLSSTRRVQLTIGLQALRKQNLAGKYDYNGADAEEFTVKDLEERNFQYLISESTTYEVPVTYSQQLKRGRDTEMFIKLIGYYTNTENFHFNNRKSFRISIGTTF